jgi:5-oxoprolinase (ATP-hydrolysing) subunit B
VRIVNYGEHAVMAELDDATAVPRVRAAVGEEPGVVDAVAGARTVLVVLAPDAGAEARAAVRAALLRTGTGAPEHRPRSEPVVVPVVYDGADLADVAAEIGLSVDEVIALHTRADYVVRFCGFSPGFAYLDGLDARLQVPRRSEPRTSVPAGSVAVAGEFTGIYPRRSPGGWRLLGRTDLVLWDPARTEPALLVPGAAVRFERR